LPVPRTCERCAAEFFTPPSHKARFCSIACRDAGKSVDYVCPTCGKAFRYRASTPRKFCSKKCAGVETYKHLGKHSEGRSIDLTCEQCGLAFRRWAFEAAKVTRHFCGKACYNAWQTGQVRGPRSGNFPRGANHHNYKGKIAHVCERCGKTFEKFPSQSINGQGRFCSRASTRNRVELPCEQCGEVFTVKAAEAGTARFCSKACRFQWQRTGLVGDNNPNWKGGYSPYYGPNWRAQKRNVRRRDNYTCQHCGIAEADLRRQLDVHHIRPFREFGVERYREANAMVNLISLCDACHKRLDIR
jgi:endogenous inhibitor of DNA gyrase (YacG/DUF329 family)